MRVEMKVLVTSLSVVKRQAVEEYFKSKFPDDDLVIEQIDCTEAGLPQQPIGVQDNIIKCAKVRLNYATRHTDFDLYDFVVSIENGICYSTMDRCAAIIHQRGTMGAGLSFMLEFNRQYLDQLLQLKLDRYSKHIVGYPVTIGELIQKDRPDVDPNNWMATVPCKMNHITNILETCPRQEQIKDAIDNAFTNLEKYNESKKMLLSNIKTYNDFPKKGILFQDIFTLTEDATLMRELSNYMYNMFKYDEIDYIIGLESRGFIVGMMLASKLNIGFIPVRKAGKLPGKTISVEYGKEYGKDICEMQIDTRKQGARVLIVDDLVATGGTIQAAIDLVERQGMYVVDCCVLTEVFELRESYKKNIKYPCNILLKNA